MEESVPLLADAVADRPTLADVALRAGVSTATVSRVLTGSARVSEGTNRLVQQAISELGYVRRRAPWTHRPTGGSVAAIVTESSERFFSDPFFARLLHGASRALVPVGYQLAFVAVRDRSEYAAAARFVRRGVDGVLLVSSHGPDPLMPLLDTAGVPTVLCGRPLAEHGAPYVDTDNYGGAQAAVHHLLAAGRQRLGTIAGPSDMAASQDRLRGFTETLAATGLEPVAELGDFSLESGERAMTRLLRRRPDLDAVFVASDLMAAGALRALRRAGRRVPDDVAVIGFDDDPVAQHTHPPLSTVRQPVEEQGATMARHVLALIGNGTEPGRSTLLPTTLVRRESA
ncbi:LacI family DNA-binding transcriptional regulator [Kitasatospora saccharophila]|uniref:LacI family DNA-binding transcriptional regulator n=1 Tax=Kitasatospora saccharophila TaxID=407973 RepID=UPI0031CE15B3